MRRVEPLDKRAAAYSAVLHSTIFVVAWLSALQQGPEFEFIAYEIELVSPPPAAQADEPQPPTEELIVERPEPEPPPPEPEEEIVPIEVPDAEPEPETEPIAPEPEPDPLPEPDVVDAPAASTEPPPEPESELSGEDLNVRLEGLRRDYPVYYENIIRQVQRCFSSRWRQGGSWETMIVFTIGRDGIASDIEFGARSGNVAFDYVALEAVGDCAGQGRFGPLPEDLPWPELRISFTFEPPSDQE